MQASLTYDDRFRKYIVEYFHDGRFVYHKCEDTMKDAVEESVIYARASRFGHTKIFRNNGYGGDYVHNVTHDTATFCPEYHKMMAESPENVTSRFASSKDA